MMKQAILTDGLVNYLLFPIQCHLNGVHISEVHKFVAESPSVTTHTKELTDSFNAAHQFIIPL